LKKFLFTAIILFIVIYVLPLGYRPAIIPDETRYAEIPREILQSGDWTVPHFNGLRYFEKPVLAYWANAVSMKIFGQNEFAMRFPSALSVGISALLIFFAAAKFRKSQTQGVLAAAIFLTCQEVFFVGTFNVMDSMLTMFLNAALFSFYYAYSEVRYKRFVFLCLFGIFCGLAFLTKGFLAFVLPVATIVPFLLWEKRWKLLFRLPWLPLIMVLVVSLPWCISVHFRESDFWNYFVWVEHIKRFIDSSNEFQHPEPFWFFVPVLLLGALPWTFLLPAAFMGFRKSDLKDAFTRYLLCWFILGFLFFSASNGKLATYILPCFAPLSILFSGWLVRYFEGGFRKTFDVTAIIMASIFGIGGLLFLINQSTGFPVTAFSKAETWKWIVGVIAFWSWGSLLFLSFKASDYRKKLALFCAAPFVLMFVSHFILPDQVKERKAPGDFLMRHAPMINKDTIIVSYKSIIGAVNWYYKRDDVYLVMEKGELEYGFSYKDSKHRFISVEELNKLIRENSGKKPVALIIRSKIYNEDCKNNLPKPAYEKIELEFTFAEYK